MNVRVDPQRGHITLYRDGEAAVVTLVELGPVLNLWQYEGGVEIDTEVARELGEALVAWAARKAGALES
ncbi:hypothetical protein NOK12_16350 [Nocardioides sp. OK12]|uniref:hypothetical protein n=1 Tax=Nocardioides sp. OK12 TaxID=2758661 RepID=UPI0021C3F5DF|nr:hypothetical protein [Nocardioides sp. OK12]GHJ59117.1 hypothetical protein NOK12_16350 [Nocardioides sp. OK12]